MYICIYIYTCIYIYIYVHTHILTFLALISSSSRSPRAAKRTIRSATRWQQVRAKFQKKTVARETACGQ